MAKKYIETQEKKQTAILAMAVLDSKKDRPKEDLIELKGLAEANNLEILGEVVQNRDKPDPAFLLGKGKVQELKELVQETNADMVIFDNLLSGSRLNNLEEVLGVKVLDRAMLILDIFAQRALSGEGKLQVELAQLKYSLPRLNGLTATNNRYGGGIGMRGPGETKLELNRRIIERNIILKEKELKKLESERELRRANRNKSDKKCVALVGYTNSGKSTLLNSLTKANVLAKDMLFATLDTTTRELYLGDNKQILITDTVGFVNKLPHELVEAFKSTLMEAVNADLLIHVVDATSKERATQEEVVLNVLKSLGATNVPVITVYNKCDKPYEFIPAGVLKISAKQNEGLDKLKQKIIEILFEN